MTNPEPPILSNKDAANKTKPIQIIFVGIVMLALGTMVGIVYMVVTIFQANRMYSDDMPELYNVPPSEIIDSSFYVEEVYNTPESRSYFSSMTPEGVTISYETTGTTAGKTVINYLGERLLEIRSAHIAVPTELEDFHKITDSEVDGLVRVSNVTGGWNWIYTNMLFQNWGGDQCPEGVVSSIPCYKPVLTLPGATSLEVLFVGDEENLWVADDFVKNMRFDWDNSAQGSAAEESSLGNTLTDRAEFYVESDYGSPQTRRYFVADKPQNVTVDYEVEGTTGGKTVMSLDGQPLLEFKIEHMLIPMEVTSYEEMAGSRMDNLYRAYFQDVFGWTYTSELTLEGTCEGPGVVLDAPCGIPLAPSGEGGVTVTFLGDESNMDVADSIIKSLEVTN